MTEAADFSQITWLCALLTSTHYIAELAYHVAAYRPSQSLHANTQTNIPSLADAIAEKYGAPV